MEELNMTTLNASQAYTATVGRLLLGTLFLFSGIGKLAAPAATIGYIGSVGMPFPLLAYLGAIGVEVGLASLLLMGYKTRWVAAIMAGFTLMTAVVFHNNLADQNQLIHFLKNIAITGGLLQVVAFGSGAFSLDGALSKRRLALA
ncbi:DoxX family protein [Pseudomonas lutea]|uniref:DoxX family protein n=2 Tax=Pseudomonas luteola TaxID=47886 RepID=A0ABS0MP50_PSELU|nr:DoxX family protein [Pseudomonas luteola]